MMSSKQEAFTIKLARANKETAKEYALKKQHNLISAEQQQDPAFNSMLEEENRAKQFIIPRAHNDLMESTKLEPHASQAAHTTGSMYTSLNKQ